MPAETTQAETNEVSHRELLELDSWLSEHLFGNMYSTENWSVDITKLSEIIRAMAWRGYCGVIESWTPFGSFNVCFIKDYGSDKNYGDSFSSKSISLAVARAAKSALEMYPDSKEVVVKFMNNDAFVFKNLLCSETSQPCDILLEA